MRLRSLASIAAALLLPVLLSSPASAYDMGAPDTPVRLSAGLSHTAFVDQEGVLWTWGSNQSGQLGAPAAGRSSNRGAGCQNPR